MTNVINTCDYFLFAHKYAQGKIVILQGKLILYLKKSMIKMLNFGYNFIYKSFRLHRRLLVQQPH